MSLLHIESAQLGQLQPSADNHLMVKDSSGDPSQTSAGSPQALDASTIADSRTVSLALSTSPKYLLILSTLLP
jgi:hypothetical protein